MRLLYLLLIMCTNVMDGYKFVGLLRNQTDNICTLALVRPRWLLGSIDYCKVNLEQYFDKPVVYKDDDLHNFTLIIDNKVADISSLVVPEKSLYRKLIIVELEYYEFEDMLRVCSLQYIEYNMVKECDLYSFTYIGNDLVRTNRSLSRYFSGKKPLLYLEKRLEGGHNGPLFCYLYNDSLPKLVGFKIKSKEEQWVVVDELNRMDDYLVEFLENVDDDIFSYNYIGFLVVNENVCPIVLIAENWFVGSKKKCKLSTDNCKISGERAKTVIFSRMKNKKSVRDVVKFIYLNEYDYMIDQDVFLVKVNQITIGTDYRFVNIPQCMPIDQSDVHWTHCRAPKKYVGCYSIIGNLLQLKFPVFQSKYVYPQKVCKHYNTTVRCGVVSESFGKSPGIIMCKRYTNEYDLVGFEIENFRGELLIESLVDKTAILKYAKQDQKSLKKYPVIIELTNGTHSCVTTIINKKWLIGSMNDCFFQSVFDDLKRNTDWKKWTAVMTNKNVGISQIVFSSNYEVKSKIILIKLKRSFLDRIYTIIPKSIPCETYMSVSISTSTPNFDIDFNSELPTFCPKNEFICTKPNKNIGTLLFSETIQNYQLIGIFHKRPNHTEWFSIIPYQNWITKIINQKYEPKHFVQDLAYNHTKIKLRRNDLVSEKEDRTVLFMIKIYTSIYYECYGYLISRNWVITNNNCHFHIATKNYTLNSMIPLKSITYAKVQTKNMDVYLISHVMYPSVKNANLNNTFIFLRLLWPVILEPNTEIIDISTKLFHVGTPCAIISDNPTVPKEGSNAPIFHKIKTTLIETSICKGLYEHTDIPWNHVYCSKSVKPLYPNSVLICNFQLASILINRWNLYLHIRNIYEGPISWIRLDSLKQQIEIVHKDMVGLKQIKYGRKADVSKWKFLASIRYKQYHLFTATLISKHFLLTSNTYSAEDINNSLLDLHVVFNGFDLYNDTNNKIFKIKEAKRISGKLPLIIIRLITPVRDIPMISIPSQIKFGQLNCIAAGWPRDSITRWYHYDNFQKFNFLREESFITFPIESSTFNAISINKFCLADYGVPLICNNQLIGINSYDDSCKLSEWLNVPKYLEHIERSLTKSQINNWGKYLALLLIEDIYTCIGTLIHARWVLTAAVCVIDTDPDQIRVVFKIRTVNDLEKAEKRQIIYHKISNTNSPKTSIAMLLLKRTMPLESKQFGLLDLIHPNKRDCSSFAHTEDLTAGWPDDYKSSTNIQVNRIYEKPIDYCQNNIPNKFNDSKESLICMVIYERSKRITYLNYPGAPLVCADVNNSYRIQYGVNIWGLSRRDEVNTVIFAKIVNSFDWIQQNLKRTPEDTVKMSRRSAILEYFEEPFDTARANYITLVFYMFLIVINPLYFYLVSI